MIIKTKLTLSQSSTGEISLIIIDADANALLAKVELTPQIFCDITIGSLARVECDAEIGPLDKIGKKREVKKFQFEIPREIYGERERIAKEFAVKNCPDGWEPDLYFGSQDSFFYHDGRCWAQCSIYRWVEKEDS